MKSEHAHDTDAAIQRLLTEEDSVAEQGIDITVRHDVVTLTGDVESDARRDEVARRVVDLLPGLAVRNEIEVTCTQAPDQPEELP